MLRNILTFVLLCPFVIFGQEKQPNLPQNYDEIIANYKHFTLQQLSDTAYYYLKNNDYARALSYYNLLINTPMKSENIEWQKRKIIVAYINSGQIYANLSDYNTAYEFYIKALNFCDKTEFLPYQYFIYNNLGDIYGHFKMHDITQKYFAKALSLCNDSIQMVLCLNNLGDNAIRREKFDSAFFYLNNALQISKLHNNVFLDAIFSTMAETYQKIEQYDSALHYFRVSLIGTRKNSLFEIEAFNLSKLGGLFYELNDIDSALFYIDLSNIVAKENNLLRILADNYLTLSQIEESKRRITNAFDYFKTYAALKDSMFGVNKFSEINQLQRLYEVSKTNQEIERLIIEQHIKENTIKYQRIIWFITLGVFAIVCIVLFIIVLQKRKLKMAYNALVEKNVEIIKLQKNHTETDTIKIKKRVLSDDVQDELLNNILTVMEDKTVICDPEFSIDKLAGLVNFNHKYVSEIINTALKKNFRSFLNSYRIEEAQRLFLEKDTEKYTLEFVASQVGFKSRNSFREIFKEVTGVTPTFYIKSLQEKQNTIIKNEQERNNEEAK